MPLFEAGKKQWWPSNRGICLATGAGGGACWNPVELADGKAEGKETFLDLVKLGVFRPRRGKQTHRDQERSVGGRAGIESAYLDTLQTQTGKSFLPFPKCAEAESPPRPHPELSGCPAVDKFEEGTTFPSLQFARVPQDVLAHVQSVKSGICSTQKAATPLLSPPNPPPPPGKG